MRTRNIITLTTIPPRYDTIQSTLRSLCAQDADIDRVILTLPRNYQKRDFGTATLPDLPDGVEILHTDTDLGPATKILPVAKNFRGQDVRLLYCDDDRIYDRDWAARLIAHNAQNPGMCVADAGDPVSAIDLRAERDEPIYRRLNALTLGLLGKPHRRRVRSLIPDEGLIDIAKGYGGVLIRPTFLGDDAFCIPETFWAVDDVWLSGQMARQGIPIHKVGRQPKSTPTPVGKMSALLDLELDGNGRDKLNLACVNYFRTRYGIWGGPTAGRGAGQGNV
jgi:hypothetical protein